MQTANRVAKNTGLLYARMAITVFISLYATRLILNALGGDDFGIFNVVGGAIAMLTFLNGAMAAATQRFMSYSQGEGNTEKQKSIFNVSVVLHFIIGFLVVILLEGVSYYLFNGVLKIDPNRLYAAKMIYHFMVVSTFFTIISVPYDAVINAHENMLYVAIVGIFEALLKLGVAIYVTQTGFDKLVTYGLLMACISITVMLVMRFYCHLKYEEVVLNPKKYFNKPLFKEMTSFAGWSFLGSASSMIAGYGQGIVLNVFFGTIVNAAQGIANQTSGQLGAFAGTMLKALNPVIAKSEGAGNRSTMLKAAMFGSKISFFLLVFFVIPIIIEMPYILKLWLKNVPEYAIIFCRLYLLLNLISQLFVTLSATISAVGNIRKYQIITSVINFLPIIFSYYIFMLGVPPYYLYIVFMLFAAISGGINLYFAQTNCGLSSLSYLKQVVKPCIISFVTIYSIGIAPVLFFDQSLVRLFFVFILSGFSYVFVVWRWGLANDEKEKFILLFNSIRSRFKLQIIKS